MLKPPKFSEPSSASMELDKDFGGLTFSPENSNTGVRHKEPMSRRGSMASTSSCYVASELLQPLAGMVHPCSTTFRQYDDVDSWTAADQQVLCAGPCDHQLWVVVGGRC